MLTTPYDAVPNDAWFDSLDFRDSPAAQGGSGKSRCCMSRKLREHKSDVDLLTLEEVRVLLSLAKGQQYAISVV
jgi:hypothetical protein